jgi:competence protein ComEC
MRINPIFAFFAIFLLVLADFFVWKEILTRHNALEVIFFDVGQGDSIFIESPQGHQILIDGGPSGKRVLEKLAKEIPFWDRSLDMVVLTHPDYDHLSGLNYVLKRYKVENILWSGIKRETKTYQYWLENLEKEKKEGAKIIIAKRGQSIKAGKLSFYILYPFESLEGKLFEKASNDTSVVSKVVFGGAKFLFPGDITSKTEKKLIAKEAVIKNPNLFLRSDVLKIPHHGSKTSTSKKFLEIVAPKLAVISVGKNNPYGHPRREVLNLLKDFDIKVLRTDLKGDIKIKTTNGEYLEVR